MDAEAGAGLLVDALLAVDQGAPAAMLGSHANVAAAVLFNLMAPLMQLAQGGEAEARAIAPGVVSTSTGARPPLLGRSSACCACPEQSSGCRSGMTSSEALPGAVAGLADGTRLRRVVACVPGSQERCRMLQRWALPRRHWARRLPAGAWRLAALHAAQAEAAAAATQQQRLCCASGGADGLLGSWASGGVDASA